MDQAPLEHISGHVKKKVIGKSQHGFPKGKSCLNSLTALKMTEFMNKGRAVGVIYLNLSKAFDNCLPQYSCIQAGTLGSGRADNQMGE